MIDNTYTRADLQQLPAKFRREQISYLVESTIANNVISAARGGKTEYFWRISMGKNHKYGIHDPSMPTFTDEEIIEVLKEKFPDTTVEAKEEWIETRPGFKEQKKGILIDWS